MYSIKSNNVISDYSSKYDNLTVSYKETLVESFTVSKILFFNRGTETITRQDLETIHPLSISSESCHILDTSILQANKASNNFRVSLNSVNENVLIFFDYLDKNQGAVIEVVHTGTQSIDLDVSGDIIGVQKLSEVRPEILSTYSPMKSSDKRTFGILTLLGSIGWGILIFGGDYVNSLFKSRNLFAELLGWAVFAFVVIGVGLVGGLAFSLLVFAIRPFQVSNEIPRGLEKFNE